MGIGGEGGRPALMNIEYSDILLSHYFYTTHSERETCVRGRPASSRRGRSALGSNEGGRPASSKRGRSAPHREGDLRLLRT